MPVGSLYVAYLMSKPCIHSIGKRLFEKVFPLCRVAFFPTELGIGFEEHSLMEWIQVRNSIYLVEKIC